MGNRNNSKTSTEKLRTQPEGVNGVLLLDQQWHGRVAAVTKRVAAPKVDQPIRGTYHPGLINGMIHREENLTIEAESARRVFALFSKYGIPDGDWRALATRLAREHEPSLQVVPKGGQQPEFSVSELAQFRMCVDLALELGASNVDEAISRALSLPPLSRVKEKNKSLPRLRRIYHGVDRQAGDDFRRATMEQLRSQKL